MVTGFQFGVRPAHPAPQEGVQVVEVPRRILNLSISQCRCLNPLRYVRRWGADRWGGGYRSFWPPGNVAEHGHPLVEEVCGVGMLGWEGRRLGSRATFGSLLSPSACILTNMLSFGAFAGRSFDVRKSFVRSSCNVRGDFSAKFGP